MTAKKSNPNQNNQNNQSQTPAISPEIVVPVTEPLEVPTVTEPVTPVTDSQTEPEGNDTLKPDTVKPIVPNLPESITSLKDAKSVVSRRIYENVQDAYNQLSPNASIILSIHTSNDDALNLLTSNLPDGAPDDGYNDKRSTLRELTATVTRLTQELNDAIAKRDDFQQDAVKSIVESLTQADEETEDKRELAKYEYRTGYAAIQTAIMANKGTPVEATLSDYLKLVPTLSNLIEGQASPSAKAKSGRVNTQGNQGGVKAWRPAISDVTITVDNTVTPYGEIRSATDLWKVLKTGSLDDIKESMQEAAMGRDLKEGKSYTIAIRRPNTNDQTPDDKRFFVVTFKGAKKAPLSDAVKANPSLILEPTGAPVPVTPGSITFDTPKASNDAPEVNPSNDDAPEFGDA